jgi:uncharacterized protein YbcI
VVEHANVFGHVGFSLGGFGGPQGRRTMDKTKLTMAQQVARAAGAFQQQRTGHAPRVVTVVLGGDTLVITLHDALSPAEQALAKSPAGAAQVQEFHRQLFANSANSLREEIKKITGVEVREAAAEVETTTGTVVHAFTNGTMVQVFLLAQGISEGDWSRDGPAAAEPPGERPPSGPSKGKP